MESEDAAIILEIDDGSDQPCRWVRVGKPMEVIQAEIGERLKGMTHGELSDLNRVNLAQHVHDLAVDEYIDQFKGVGLIAPVMQEIQNLDVDYEITIRVKKVTSDEWQECLKLSVEE